MRIITGSRRGRKLKTLPGDAVRPTPDRVKEALFNILQFDLEGRVFLDPPYRTGTLTKALLAVTPHMNRGGIVICEHPTDEELPETAGEFVRVRDYRYGKILLTAYRHQSMV